MKQHISQKNDGGRSDAEFIRQEGFNTLETPPILDNQISEQSRTNPSVPMRPEQVVAKRLTCEECGADHLLIQEPDRVVCKYCWYLDDVE